jgi:phage gpG-like protein
MENFDKAYKPQNWKKKKRKREGKTLIIFVSSIPATNIMP